MKVLSPAFVALLLFGVGASAQTPTFTYQGRLTDSGTAPDSVFDMRFTLHDTPLAPNQIGSAITNAAVPVTNGLFTVSLNFGAAAFNGGDRWLQIGVRPAGNTNPHTLLLPRQQVTSTPYAIQALNAANAANATNLVVPLQGTNITGTIPLTNLPPTLALLNSNADFLLNVSAAQFNGSGAGLSNVPGTALVGIIPDARLSTNVARLNTNATFNGTLTATNFSGYGGGLTNVPGRLFDNIPVGSPIQAMANTGYLATNNTLPVVITLPASANIRVGETVRVSGGGAGGWIIAQNANQSILVANLIDGIINWTARETSRAWRAVASSTDGTKLVAAVNAGFIYTSSDSGTTWTNRTTAGSRNWRAVASSADGSKLVAAVNTGFIYTSVDSGVNWVERAGTGGTPWTALASSLDGTILLASVGGGTLGVSTNSGANWTVRENNRNWSGVACSADGTRMVATVTGGEIYISTNTGATWTPKASIQAWSGVASSYDGSRLVATVAGGQIQKSADYGATWTPVATADPWSTVGSSADGARLIAGQNTGELWVSLDSGATWTVAPGTPTTVSWTGATFSGDGSTAMGVASVNQIFVSSQTSTTRGQGGFLQGTRQCAIDLIYIGNDQFMPVTFVGAIRAH